MPHDLFILACVFAGVLVLSLLMTVLTIRRAQNVHVQDLVRRAQQHEPTLFQQDQLYQGLYDHLVSCGEREAKKLR